jgi:lipoprotein signal peptidase
MKKISLKFNHFITGIEIAHVFFVALIVVINLFISSYLRNQGLFFVANQTPIGHSFGYYSSLLILLFSTWAVIKFDFLHKTPVYAILILAGLYSNFVEKVMFNSVADYLPLGSLYLNLADSQIFLGLLILNLQSWIPKVKVSLEVSKSKSLV